MTGDGPDPALVALGREVQRLTHAHADAVARVEELTELLTQLATDVATLAARSAPDGDEAVRAWLLTSDPDLAQTDLDDLADWLARVYLRYPDAVLPSCWLWHPAAIEELRWLRCAHREAYHDKHGTWAKAGDWHDRYRPGVARRLAAAYGSCELREHAHSGSQHRPAPTVALADLAPITARAWTATPDTPLIPTDQQIREAEHHDTTTHHRGTR
ncbi:MAG: hypothetical protein ACRDRI_05635 [Pseudonocardiaceae bacterium]